MIDQSVFKAEWAILADRFNRTFSAPLVARYYQYLTARLDTAAFRQACDAILASHEFFPTPDQFIEATEGTSQVLALDQWELCQRIAEGEYHIIERMDAAGQKVVRLLGGPTALGSTQVDRVNFLRGEFLRVYLDVAESRVHQINGPEVTPESRQIVGDLMRQAKELKP